MSFPLFLGLGGKNVTLLWMWDCVGKLQSSEDGLQWALVTMLFHAGCINMMDYLVKNKTSFQRLEMK